MKEISTAHLRHLHGLLGETVYELSQVRFTQFASREIWRPAINAYHCTGQISICVDLAGVDREKLELRVQQRRQ